MWKWLEEFYEVRRNHKERLAVCLSCEVLKVELSNARRMNETLLSRILNPQPQVENTAGLSPQPVILRHKPWKVKQQELEKADRQEHERILTEFKNKIAAPLTEKLEKELGIENG